MLAFLLHEGRETIIVSELHAKRNANLWWRYIFREIIFHMMWTLTRNYELQYHCRIYWKHEAFNVATYRINLFNQSHQWMQVLFGYFWDVAPICGGYTGSACQRSLTSCTWRGRMSRTVSVSQLQDCDRSPVSDNTPGTSETPLCTHSAQKLNLLQVFTLPKTDS